MLLGSATHLDRFGSALPTVILGITINVQKILCCFCLPTFSAHALAHLGIFLDDAILCRFGCDRNTYLHDIGYHMFIAI